LVKEQLSFIILWLNLKFPLCTKKS